MTAGFVVSALLGMLTLYFVLAQAPAAGVFHDDGIYLATAKALAEGEGYRVLSIPGAPPQTKYPVLFPWLLSLVWRWQPSFPANLPWLRLVPLAGTVMWLILSWPLLRRLGASLRESTAIVLVTAASPWVAFLSTTLMSESVFAAILTGSLLVMTRIHQEQGTHIDGLIAGGLAGLAVLTRTAGLAPACAGLLVLALSRRWRLSALYLVGMAVLVLPWFAWVSRQDVGAGVDTYYSATNYGSWNIIANFEWPEKLDVLRLNVFGGAVALGQIWNVFVPGLYLTVLVAVVCVMSLGRGLWLARSQPAALLTAAYCAIHAAWVWPPLRFAVPVVPLLLWFGFLGIDRSRRIGCVVALALLGVGIFQLSVVTAQARDKGVVWPAETDVDAWQETSRLLSWISEETPGDAVLTGNLDPMYYLFTGRKAVRAFDINPFLLYYNVAGAPANPLGTSEDFRKRLLGIQADYLIVTPGKGFPEAVHMRSLISQLSARFTGSLLPVAGSVNSGYVVFKINRDVLGRRNEAMPTGRGGAG